MMEHLWNAIVAAAGFNLGWCIGRHRRRPVIPFRIRACVFVGCDPDLIVTIDETTGGKELVGMVIMPTHVFTGYFGGVIPELPET